MFLACLLGCLWPHVALDFFFFKFYTVASDRGLFPAVLFTSKGSHIVSFCELICELPQDPRKNCAKIVFWQIPFPTSRHLFLIVLFWVFLCCICDVMLYTAGGHLSSHLYWSPWLYQAAFSLFQHYQKVNKNVCFTTMLTCSGVKNNAVNCIDYRILTFSVSVLY